MAGQLRLQPPLQDGVGWPCWLLGASRSLVLSARRHIAIWLVSDPVVYLCHQSHLTVVPGAPCSIVVPVVRIERCGDAPARHMPPGDQRRPLKGLRVLDDTHVIADPVAARLLATLNRLGEIRPNRPGRRAAIRAPTRRCGGR
jgi:hypothetical protein